MSTSASPAKPSSVLSDSIREMATPRRAVSTRDNAADQVKSNTFYKILLGEGASSPSERKAAFTKAMTATLQKDADRTKIKEYAEFREWLADQATTLAQQIIALTNTEVTSELQATINELATALQNYDGRMQPLMDIVDSIFQLRTNGLVLDAFREINEDREFEKQAKVDIAAKDAAIQAENVRVEQLRQTILEQKEKRVFLFGGLPESARVAIAKAESEISEVEKRIGALNSEKEGLTGQIKQRDSKLGDLVKHKDNLRMLLDLSSDEHKSRVAGLVTDAQHIINTSKDRIGSLRGQFTGLASQLEKAEDNCSTMTNIFAVMNDGLKDAEKANSEIRKTLVVSPEQEAEEDSISKITRQDNLRNLDSFVSSLGGAKVETMQKFGDLTQQAIRINTMKQATQDQIDGTRRLHSDGISAAADRIAVVLTAFQGAALGEATGTAKEVLNGLRESTNKVAEREVIRVAMGTVEVNNDLDRLFIELENLGEVQRAATGIVRNGLTEMDDKLIQLREQAEIVRKDFRESLAVASELHAESDGSSGKSTGSSGGGSPFSF